MGVLGDEVLQLRVAQVGHRLLRAEQPAEGTVALAAMGDTLGYGR